jgi:hypothetical protein
MGISTIGVAATTTKVAGLLSSSVVATATNTGYSATLDLPVGIYVVTTSNTSTVGKVEFWVGQTTLIGTVTTSSGTATFNLATAATRIVFWTVAGSSNVTISITQNATTLVSTNTSGTLDTITSATTYTTTSANGNAYVVVVGGGGGGGAGGGYFTNSHQTGGGGGAGGIASGIVALTGNVSVLIGAKGNGAVGYCNYGNAGGTSSFGNLQANGGGGGGGGQYTVPGYGGSSGTPRFPNTSNSGNGAGYSGENTQIEAEYTFVKSGTTGGGPSGDNNYGTAIGSGIGTSGPSGNSNTVAPTAATGFGAGGGGGAAGPNGTSTGGPGGDGSGGVVYVLR